MSPVTASGTWALERRGRRGCWVFDTDKAPIIRAYLELWAMKIGKFFDGLTKDSSDTEINAVAPGFPVFRITPSTRSKPGDATQLSVSGGGTSVAAWDTSGGLIVPSMCRPASSAIFCALLSSPSAA